MIRLATFVLGRQLDSDSRELREALSERLNDTDPEVRGGALVGLAGESETVQ